MPPVSRASRGACCVNTDIMARPYRASRAKGTGLTLMQRHVRNWRKLTLHPDRRATCWRCGRFIGLCQMLETGGSLRPEAGELHHLAPLFRVGRDHLAELGGREREPDVAEGRKPGLQLGVGEAQSH